MKYDAVLNNFVQVGMGKKSYLIGDIENDTKGRFADGDRVRTSAVNNIFIVGGVTYVQTQNTTYKLGTPLSK
jgi:hypothetical protein